MSRPSKSCAATLPVDTDDEPDDDLFGTRCSLNFCRCFCTEEAFSELSDSDECGKSGLNDCFNDPSTQYMSLFSTKSKKSRNSSAKCSEGSPKKTPKKTVVKNVSKEFYEKEVQKLAELVQEYLLLRRSPDNFDANLSDGGKELRAHCEYLKDQIDIKKKYLSTLQIEDVADIQKATEQQKKPSIVEAPDLPKAVRPSIVSQVQPPTNTDKRSFGKEVQKLAELVEEFLLLRRWPDNFDDCLPDGGEELREHCDSLRKEIDIKKKYIETLQMEDAAEIQKVAAQQKNPSIVEAPDLPEAVSQDQPTNSKD